MERSVAGINAGCQAVPGPKWGIRRRGPALYGCELMAQADPRRTLLLRSSPSPPTLRRLSSHLRSVFPVFKICKCIIRIRLMVAAATSSSDE